jgi:hypothetical protein
MMTSSARKPRPGPYRPRRLGIYIFDRETEALIRRLAAVTGDSIDAAVLKAVKERHEALDRAMQRRVERSRQRRQPKPRPVSA